MDQYCATDSFTLLEVMDAMQANNQRVVLIVDDEMKILGVVSQGDIIRALLVGHNSHTLVDKIMSRSFQYLFEKDMARCYKVFRDRLITLLPIVSRDFILQEVVTLLDIYNYLEATK